MSRLFRGSESVSETLSRTLRLARYGRQTTSAICRFFEHKCAYKSIIATFSSAKTRPDAFPFLSRLRPATFSATDKTAAPARRNHKTAVNRLIGGFLSNRKGLRTTASARQKNLFGSHSAAYLREPLGVFSRLVNPVRFRSLSTIGRI